MGIRPTLLRALGAFLMTTVLFAAAMVIAHGLAIPDPERRFLPTAENDGAGAAASEDAADDVAAGTGNSLGTPQGLADPPYAEVTAVPTPDTATGNSLRDDARNSASGSSSTDDDGAARDAVGDSEADRNRAGQAAANANPGRSERAGAADTPTDPQSAAAAPTTPTPTPEPRSAPAPTPSEGQSEQSEPAEPAQTSSLTAPGTDEDRADDDRDTWSNWWWRSVDRDHRRSDRYGDRDHDHHDDG
jgi:hypothetical protein